MKHYFYISDIQVFQRKTNIFFWRRYTFHISAGVSFSTPSSSTNHFPTFLLGKKRPALTGAKNFFFNSTFYPTKMNPQQHNNVPRPAIIIPPPPKTATAQKRTVSERDNQDSGSSASAPANPPASKLARSGTGVVASFASSNISLSYYFDPAGPVTTVIMEVFSKHLLPFLTEKELVNLSLVSKNFCEIVKMCGRVSLRQILYVLRNPNFGKDAVVMFDRFALRPSITSLDMFAVFCIATIQNYNVSIAERVVETIARARLTSVGKTRSLYMALLHHAVKQTPWSDVSQGLAVSDRNAESESASASASTSTNDELFAFRNFDKTESFTVGAAAGCEHASEAFKHSLRDIVWSQHVQNDQRFAESFTSAIGQCSSQSTHITAHTRVSRTLLKLLVSSGAMSVSWLAENMDSVISSIIKSIELLENSGETDLHNELDAIDFIVSTCAFKHSNDLPRTACALAATKCKTVHAPETNLLQKLRPNVGNWSKIDQKVSPSPPIRIAITHNNVDALRTLCSLAKAQDITTTSEKRLVEYAMKRKAFQCLSILIEEGFALTPGLFRNTVIEQRGAWPASERKKAFSALFRSVETLVARQRQGIEPILDYFTETVNMNFEPQKITCDIWAVTVAGDFLVSLWQSMDASIRASWSKTSSKGLAPSSSLCTRIASMSSFRKLVDFVLIGHIHHIYYGLVLGKLNSDSDSAAGNATDTPARAEQCTLLIDRIAELFDIQKRCTSAYQPSVVKAGAPVTPFEATGVGFDIMLQACVLPTIASLDWNSAMQLATMVPAIKSCFVVLTVHTDELVRFMAKHKLVSRTEDMGTLAKVLDFAVENDPDDENDGRNVLAVRRIMRWAGMFKHDAHFAGWPSVKLVEMLVERTAFYTGTPAETLLSQSMDNMLNTIISASDRFLCSHNDSPRIGGVQLVYTKYSGDVSRALIALYEELEDKRPVIEPTDEIREVLVYGMASGKSVNLTQDSVLKTVVNYTSCITLPCAVTTKWLVIPQNAPRDVPTPWIRDALRGVQPYVRWWMTQ